MSAINLDSKITEVTVFSDRAMITRVAEIDLKTGEQIVTFTALPQSVERNSIQISGRGKAEIKDVKQDTVYFTETISEQVAALQNEKKELEQKILKHNDILNEAKKEKEFIEKITIKLTATGKEQENAPLDPDKWVKMVEFYRSKNSTLNDEIRETNNKLQSLQNEKNIINNKLRDLGMEQNKSEIIVHVLLDVKESGKMSLKASYIVYGPSWSPDYDLRVDSKSKNMNIRYNAYIRQNTGEDWDDVKLSLSTAKPQINGRIPELNPWYLEYYSYNFNNKSDFARMKKSKEPAMMNQMMSADEEQKEMLSESETAPEMDQIIAEAKTGATAVVFNISGENTIISDNKNHKTAITIQDFPAFFRYSAVPKLSPYAYLKAKVKNTSDFPYLPGESHIYLDGNFVSNSSLDMIAPDQEFWTFLGIDEGIKVERKLLKKFTESVGFNKKTKVTYEYKTVVENLKKTEEEIVIWDQLPISNNKEIEVQLIKPNYQKDSDELKMNEYKYFEWYYKLKPGDKKETLFSFSVTYPKSMPLSNLD